jgi:hypothetical protein
MLCTHTVLYVPRFIHDSFDTVPTVGGRTFQLCGRSGRFRTGSGSYLSNRPDLTPNPPVRKFVPVPILTCYSCVLRIPVMAYGTKVYYELKSKNVPIGTGTGTVL